jgi:hypothetical protein
VQPWPILHFHLASGIITVDTEMGQIELVPDLSHCIETVARKEYENLARSYLQAGKGDSEFEEKVELLRSFLESADFRKLRKQSEVYLLKGQKIRFILYRERGKAKYKMLRS